MSKQLEEAKKVAPAVFASPGVICLLGEVEAVVMTECQMLLNTLEGMISLQDKQSTN